MDLPFPMVLQFELFHGSLLVQNQCPSCYCCLGDFKIQSRRWLVEVITIKGKEENTNEKMPYNTINVMITVNLQTRGRGFD